MDHSSKLNELYMRLVIYVLDNSNTEHPKQLCDARSEIDLAQIGDCEIGNSKSEIGNNKSEIGDDKSEIRK